MAFWFVDSLLVVWCHSIYGFECVSACLPHGLLSILTRSHWVDHGVFYSSLQSPLLEIDVYIKGLNFHSSLVKY